MARKLKILSRLQTNYLFAVVRGKSEEDGLEIANHCVSGGIKNIEITYSTPNASLVIKELADTYKDVNEVVIGAGTVTDIAMASQAIQAGAEFVVSPHFDPEISRICHRNAIPYLPGCGTVTEIIQAMETGVDVVKLFPGGLLGPSFIKDVHGPFPYAEMMPSGGVGITNISDWIHLGAWAVGIGSALSKNIAQEGYTSVQKEAAKFVEAMNQAKQTK